MEPNPDVAAILNCFSEPAILLSLEYEIVLANDAYVATYGFERLPRRNRCYQVSHQYSVPCDLAGESCPLKQSLATGEHSRVLHIHHTPRGEEYVNVEMWPVKDPESGEIKFFIERMHPSDAATTQQSTHKLVGRSASFREMLGLIERVARSDTNVMLLGETGTGKELVAQTVHRLSERNGKPFVPVECTGLPESLFESELFGYVKGAFTGATTSKPGLVESSAGGTLFLDEVGDISLAEQVKLLRLLETHRYRRVGSNEWHETDFRLVCATNKNLRKMVSEGTFREDLFYRLCVFEIELPPLRNRREDLPLLIDSILERLRDTSTKFSDEALASLAEYDFPGNIRELRNIVERAALLADHRNVRIEHLPSHCRTTAVQGTASDEDVVTLEEAERRYIRRVLATHHGDRRELADRLGISERALYRKLADLREST